MASNDTSVGAISVDKIKLRFDFIGMVFALAISQVGLEIGDFFKNNISITVHLYVLSHLALSVFVIASSWIGWQTSKSDGNHQPIENVFDRSFLVLLVDLALVFFYFILVRGVEKPTNQKTIAESTTEVYWSLWIFGAYFLWDCLTKLYIKDKITKTPKWDLEGFYEKSYQSFFCWFLIYLIVKPMNVFHSSTHVVITDISLLSIFVLFRGLKVVNIFKKDTYRIREYIICVVTPLLTFILCVLANYYFI